MTRTPLPLLDWARRWAIPAPAMADLLAVFGMADQPPPPPSAPPNASEAWAQSKVRLEAPKHGVWLGRNNVGALLDKRGVPVRYGLANESAAQNATLKSGDLIGIKPVTITADMVGAVVGQFVSRECKRPGWKFTGGPHETAQANWAALVTKYGGDAKFTTGEGDF